MKLRFATLIVLLIGLSTFSAAETVEYSQDMKLHSGDVNKLDSYIISFSEDGEEYLEVKRDEGRTNTILRQIESSEIYGSTPFNISIKEESLQVKVRDIRSDSNGLYLNTTVLSGTNIFSDSEMTSSAPAEMVATRSEEISIPLTLKNTGATNQSFSLSSNSSLPVSYSHTEFNITEIDVNTGETKEIDARIEIPERAEKGVHNITFIAEGKTRSTEKLSVEVQGEKKDRRIELDLQERYKVGEPGETVTARARVRNRGEAELLNVNISADSPDAWESSVRPSMADSLRARYGSEMVRISLQVPEDVEPGDYFTEINAVSENTEIDEPEELRIHIRGKSGLGHIGLGIMAFSLLLMGFVYRKFQRR